MSDDPFPSWGNTVFCDDIRAEVGGKITLIGIYTSRMTVHGTFPYVMPKFALWVNYFEGKGNTGDGKLNIFLPGDDKTPTIEADVPLNDLRASIDPANDLNDPDVPMRVRLQTPLIFTPFILKQPGRIKVRMIVGETTTRLGTLKVEQGELPAKPGN